MSTLQRSHDPGLLTLGAHYLLILLLVAILAVAWPVRVVLAWSAEVLIRLSDGLADVLAERLNQ